MTLLVVDDNRFDRTLMEKLLKKNGFDVISASNGDEALKIFGSEYIELALIDWMMPPTGGLTLCKKIRETEAGSERFCYLIIVTSKSEPRDEVKAFESGINDFISKPYDEDVLLARVRAGIGIVNDRNSLIELIDKERK
jgi:DNA-binding response OmpR family regulator